MTDGLFEMTPTPPAPRERLSADRARTERQRRDISTGAHPLWRIYPTVRHPDTLGKSYERDDERGKPLTCGSCVFRELYGAGNRTVGKCTARDGRPRATQSASSDVRAWWPACRDYEPAQS
jgi:hypothetical protein